MPEGAPPAGEPAQPVDGPANPGGAGGPREREPSLEKPPAGVAPLPHDSAPGAPEPGTGAQAAPAPGTGATPPPSTMAPSGPPGSPSPTPAQQAAWPPPQQAPAPGRAAHDQQTIAVMPPSGGPAAAPGYPPPRPPAGAPGVVPPPPIAPTGPGTGYGHPGPPAYFGQSGYPGAPAAGSGAPGGYPGYAAGPGYQGSGPAYPASYPGYGWPGMGMPQNGQGTTALVLGILAVCLCWLYGVVSLVLGTLAVIFGVKARKRVARGEATNGGQAMAGFVLGIIGIVLGVAIAILIGFAISEAVNDRDGTDGDYGYSADAAGADRLPDRTGTVDHLRGH